MPATAAGSLGDLYMSEAEYKRRFEAKRVGQKRERESRALAAPQRPNPREVWSDAENALLATLMAKGLFAYQMVEHFPTKTMKQIRGRAGTINNSNREGGLSGLGLQMSERIEPDPQALAERAVREDAEAEPVVYLNPNHSLLGDPSPARLATARKLQAEAAQRTPYLGGWRPNGCIVRSTRFRGGG